MAIVRKVVVTAAERIDDSTILDVAVIDHNTADPPASKQVGRSMTIEVEDDESQEGTTLEDWFDSLRSRNQKRPRHSHHEVRPP